MRSPAEPSTPLDIIAAWLRPAVVAAVAAGALTGPASAQSLDSTLEEILDDELTEQVEDELTDALEETVEETIEEQVQEQVESEIAETVEQQVEGSVEQTIQDEIEAGITQTIESQVETGITETIESQLEAGITETIEDQLESGITETIEDQLESGITETIEDQVEAGVGRIVELELESAIEDALDAALDVVGVADEALEDLVETADDALDVPDGDTETSPDAQAQTETFVPAVDGEGRAVEAQVWVVLVPSEYADRIEGWGLTVRERQDLDSLDRVLLRVDAPEDGDIVEAALELALDAPGTLVDYNHVYAGAQTAAAAALGERLPGPSLVPAAGGLAIGIIDSAVAVEHAALRSAAIAERDFVPFDGNRPREHGTAVASILVGKSASMQGRAPEARLYAASVFFEDGTGREVATTASLVAALDWLNGAESVAVVNMSLAGPPNAVLEGALDTVARQGLIVVAAVGNNGPAGDPLYPAAYDAVVGVTAVDSANRIYHYANRGRHVMFAAPGVDVLVAASHGGFRTATGTSMAAPHAAAMIAAAMAQGRDTPHEALERLQARAVDLGEKDFDEVFGFGLVVAD